MQNSQVDYNNKNESRIIPGMTVEEVRGLPSSLIDSILTSTIFLDGTRDGIKELIKDELDQHTEIKQYQIEKAARISQTIKSI